MTDHASSTPFGIELARFLDRCAAYAASSNISEARLSTLLFNHGARISQIRERGNAGTAALDAAASRLALLEEQLACVGNGNLASKISQQVPS
jgi:hypothetical protein